MWFLLVGGPGDDTFLCKHTAGCGPRPDVPGDESMKRLAFSLITTFTALALLGGCGGSDPPGNGGSGGTGDEDEAICIAGAQAAGLTAG